MTRHFTAREFTPDLASAARNGPVTITDEGQPAFVLLNVAEYRRLLGQTPSLADRLSNPEVAEIDFELPPRTIDTWREIDLD